MKPHSFNLSQLKHYNRSLIYQWLRLHDTDSFTIEIDWEIYDDMDDELQFVFNYTSAAYTGELLSNCAQSIQYNAPLPRQQPFLFILSKCNKKILAGKLAAIVQGYFDDEDGMTRFSILSSQYLINVLDGKIITHVPALIHLAEQYLP
jgi:hypothetical protein